MVVFVRFNILIFLGLMTAGFTALSYAAKVESTRLLVACAANFHPVAKQLATLFEVNQGGLFKVVIVTGSSGALTSQILHGAPYDLFLSADKGYPTQLRAKGIGLAQATYARGILIWYSPQISMADWSELTELSNIAIANPRHAPYGRAALEVLSKLDIDDVTVVKGNSVLQAFKYIQTGHAAGGFIAKSLSLSLPNEAIVIVPEQWYQPIEQDMLLLSDNTLADDFYRFMLSEQAHQLIELSGYRVDASHVGK